MLKNLILCFSLCLLAVTSRAQDTDYSDLHEKHSLNYRTFRVAFIPGLSTNGLDAKSYASKYSFNILAGYNGALDRGFELGGLLNLNKYYAHGGQIAGLGNYSGRETSGIQLAGLFNYSERDMQGIQLSGALNISEGDMQGLQLTGISNWAKEYAQGIQLSGALNYAGKEMQGLFFSGAANIGRTSMQGLFFTGAVNYTGEEMQGIAASGLFNYSAFMQGIVLAPININKEAQGIQIGNLNISDRMEGIQVGLINYAKEMEGLPVGLISYYNNGRKNIDIWTSDAGFTNFGVKLGTTEVYNMVSIGYNPALRRDVWQLGWSIGRLHEYRNHFLLTDFSVFKINEGDWTKGLNSLFKYRLQFGKQLGNGFSVYAGPTFNMLVSRVDGSSDYTWYRIFDFGAKGRDYVFWVGYSLGIQLF